MNRARTRLGPLWPYAVLVGLPAGVFVLPDLLGGHLVMTGDNVQQNYPLHVLVGSMLRRGQLPFWNPYLFRDVYKRQVQERQAGGVGHRLEASRQRLGAGPRRGVVPR